MSLGGGGGGDGGATWMLVQQLQAQRDEANAQAAAIKAQNDAQAATVETKRQQRARGGGLSAFATNGYTGYSDRVLGGGDSLAQTV